MGTGADRGPRPLTYISVGWIERFTAGIDVVAPPAIPTPRMAWGWRNREFHRKYSYPPGRIGFAGAAMRNATPDARSIPWPLRRAAKPECPDIGLPDLTSRYLDLH